MHSFSMIPPAVSMQLTQSNENDYQLQVRQVQAHCKVMIYFLALFPSHDSQFWGFKLVFTKLISNVILQNMHCSYRRANLSWF